MEVHASTFGATQEKINAFDNQQNNQPPIVDTGLVVAPPVQSDAPQATVPVQDNNTNQPPVQDPSNTPPPETDFSTSEFSLGGDEQPEQTNQQQSAPQATQPQFNLDEEIKKIDRKELLKKAGVSDFVIEMDTHLANGGKADDYISAKAVNYNEVSDENIIKNNLKTQFPTFTPQQIELYYNRKYGIREDALDDEKEFAELERKADAHNIRQQLISNQQKFKTPDAITPPKDEAYEQYQQYRESQVELAKKHNDYFLNHAATKELHESKRVVINVGEGVQPFNAVIDKPEMITNTFLDGGQTWAKLTSTQTGEPDVKKQQLLSLFLFNPQKFIQNIFSYGQQHGQRKLMEEGQNAQRPQPRVIPLDKDAKPVYNTGTYGSKTR